VSTKNLCQQAENDLISWQMLIKRKVLEKMAETMYDLKKC
jgi:hypothetical protein